MIHRFAGATLCALCLAAAQSAAQAVPEFELVSVRRSPPASTTPAGTSGIRAGIQVLPGGRFEARRQTLADLARVAFGFEDVDPSNGIVEADEPWQWNDQFDITAAADHQWTTPPSGGKVPAELRTMLRGLLQERFELKARIGSKNVDVTAVRLAKQNVLGPGLRPSTADCLGPFTTTSPGEASPKPRCPFVQTTEFIDAQAVTMSEAVQLMARIQGLFVSRFEVSRPILVDQSNLTGRYDLSLRIPADQKNPLPGNGLQAGSSSHAAADIRSLAVIGAIETQLGLKLVSARAKVPALVIEKARKPRED